MARGDGSRAQGAADFSSGLHHIMEARGIAPTAAALEAVLLAKGVTPPHRNTLRKALRGERLPQPSTQSAILDGLAATVVERQMASGVADAPDPDETQTIARSLAGDGRIDRGRDSERLAYTYHVGLRSEDDRVVEHRLTWAGRDGMRIAQIGPGQLGSPSFDLRMLDQLDLTVSAKVAGPQERPLKAVPQVSDIGIHKAEYSVFVFFGETICEELVEWVVRYRWPGVWDPLRDAGRDVGRVSLKKRKPVRVDSLTINVPVPTVLSGDPRLEPDDPTQGEVRTKRFPDATLLTWHIEHPPVVSRYSVYL